MLWFRVGEQLCAIFTFLFTIGILYAILDMVAKGAKTKSMVEDPSYNGTLGIYIIMIFIQIWINFTCLFGFFVAFKVWRNNYQMDHLMRSWFMMWLGSWCAAMLANLGVAIYAIIKGKDSQDEMSYIREVFTKYTTDKIFIASFEKYQRESSCCGIYGPDDWFSNQLTPHSGGGGGGGGYQSLDYGFKTNPSTGHCHLIPPTIPMGCGKKMLEEIHVKLRMIAGLAILESVIGAAAGVLAWVCFFYWLEKEVIVIPEDEISNLIVIEPESSTSTIVDEVYSTGGYLPPGASLSLRYSHQQGSYYNPSRVPRESYYSTGFDPRASGSHNHHHGSGSNPNFHSRESQRSPNRFQEYSNVKQNHGSGHVAHDNAKPGISHAPPTAKTASKSKSKVNHDTVSTHAPPNMKTTTKFNFKNKSKANKDSMSNAPTSAKTTMFKSSNKSKAKQNSPVRLPTPVSHATNILFTGKSTVQREHMLSGAGPYDANSRNRQPSMRIPDHTSYIKPHHGSYIKPHHAMPAAMVGSGRPVTVAHFDLPHHIGHAPHKKHSDNHQLHKQELALGGKVLGEMHVDHSKDPDPMNPTDVAKGEKGHKDHHATIAIVKNKNAPKPKTLLAQKGIEHHGQTGHLAEDIAEMSGKKAKKLIDDVILPVEHNPPPALGHGGYLAAHKKHGGYFRHGTDEEGMPEGVHHVNNGKAISAPSIDGSQAQNLVENLVAPVAPNRNPKDNPVIKPHYAGTPPHHHNQHGHYLPEGGPGQHDHAHYLPGAHGKVHYLGGSANLTGVHENTHYLPGTHENAHYLPEVHQTARYLQGTHENAHYLQGTHENAHYLQGTHENAHYLPGAHGKANYLPGAHYLGEHQGGSHEHAHYLGEKPHGGNHEHAHYLGEHQGGSHEHAHYLGEKPHGGNHEHAHYLGEHQRGSHEHTHYLGENHAKGSHSHGLYSGANHHGGSHEHTHYLGENRQKGSHEHGHYLNGENHHPTGSHEHGHYLGENHHNRGSHSHGHYLHEGNHHNRETQEHEGRRDTEAHFLYKNPIPIDDTD